MRHCLCGGRGDTQEGCILHGLRPCWHERWSCSRHLLLTCTLASRSPAEQDRQKLREEAAGKTYNKMAPPVAAYTSEVALASVESSLAGGNSAAAQAAAAARAIEEKRALLARSAAELDEEARKRAEQVGTQLLPWHCA